MSTKPECGQYMSYILASFSLHFEIEKMEQHSQRQAQTTSIKLRTDEVNSLEYQSPPNPTPRFSKFR